MLFESWSGLLRVAGVAAVSFAFLVLLLRTTGKRVLSKMNLFDFVITVALGSTLASVVVSKQVPLAEGLVALATLAGLQVLVSWLSVKSEKVEKAVKSNPRLLYFQGEFLNDAMEAERVNHAEILQAVRSEGHRSFEDVYAVILETNGKFSVLGTDGRRSDALKNVV